MSRRAPSDPLALAARAHLLVQRNPHAGRLAAERALRLARELPDREAEVAALHALGFAWYALGDARALPTIRRAVRIGERSGHMRRAALARRNLAVYLAYAGRSAAALREIETARASLRGIERARTEVFRIAVYGATGRSPNGLDESERALRALRRRGDRIWQARLLYNRGTLLSETGDLRAATHDLASARRLYAELGAFAAVADADIKMARVRLLEGEPLDCLTLLDAVALEQLSEWAACWLFLTRAEAHVALRLLEEASVDLARFVETAARARAVDSVRKARLDAARVALLAGDARSAAELAASARRSFAGRQPAHWARAATLSVAAAVVGNAVRPATLRTGRKAAAVLAEQGHTREELRARQLVARAALELGDVSFAAEEAQAAASLRHVGTVTDRVGYWHVQALLRKAHGDRAGAEQALRRGLDLLERYRAVFGAAELRATASTIGVELAQAGLRIAFESGDATRVLTWAERLRGNALRLPRPNSPADAGLRAKQAELRRVAARLRDGQGRERRIRGLAALQTRLESQIRDQTRRVRGEQGASVPTLRVREAVSTLDGWALVEYVELDGRLSAVTIAEGRVALEDVGRSADAAGELEWLRFAFGRLARTRSGSGRTAVAMATADAAAAALDRQLVEPLLRHLGDRPLVIVPTGGLHALPWGALPSLRGRPVVVAPSLTHWLDLTTRARPHSGGTALVAGPRLRHAKGEIRDLHVLYPSATVLEGSGASASRVLAALDGAALAHVACHGRLRFDSPLFSSLELADGPLTALDLDRLRRTPDVLVLSACDLALSSRHPGDELLGLSALILAMGTRTLIASVAPVPDLAARRTMVAFHRQLAGGASPAWALARAQEALPSRSSRAAGFVCLGVG
jgi:CHAT domain-containing protein